MLGLELNGHQSVETILSNGTHFDGDIKTDESIRINGEFNGEIECQQTLIVGPKAHINGEIHTDSAVIGGEVDGDIHATGKIELQGSGVVNGDLMAPELELEAGVVLEGNCTIDPDQAPESTTKVTSIEEKIG